MVFIFLVELDERDETVDFKNHIFPLLISIMSNESDDEGFLNEAEVSKQKEAQKYQQEQVQWMENGEKRNYESIVVPLIVGPESDNTNHISWIRYLRFYAGMVLVVAALIFVAICREAFVAPPTMQERNPGIVAEDVSRHKHQTRFPTRFPTYAPLPTFLPTSAPFSTLMPTEAPSSTIQPTEAQVTISPTTPEEEPSMLPTEASSMVLIEGASPPHHKQISAVPTMITTSTPYPTLLPTEPPVTFTPSMDPTEVSIPTQLPTEVPSFQTLNSSPTSVINHVNHVIGGVSIMGLILIGVLYGLYYCGWLGNKTADDGHFVSLK